MRDGAIEARNRQVRPEVRCAAIEANITIHCLVETREHTAHAGVRSGPIAHNETLETQFVLQQIVLRVRVLAGLAVVDLVV